MPAPQPHAIRIGLVSDHLFPFAHGGAERVYRALADAIADEGAALTYFTRAQWREGQTLDTAFDVAVVWSGDVYDERGTRTIGGALRWSGALIRRLWRCECDVLIVSATPVFNVFVGALARLRRPKMVLVVDWLEIWPWAKWRSYSGQIAGTVAWVLQSLALPFGRVRLVNSRTTLGRLPRRAQRAAIQLPLASMAGSPLAMPEKPGHELLFIGRHIPDKNLTMLPAVVAKLATEFPKLRAVVVGDGPDRAPAEALAEQLGVADRVQFVGRVSDDELDRRLAAASALFFPSVREGFGLVVCEAARHSTPSIVVDHPDNAAVALVTAGVNGEIAGDASLEELTAATRRALEGGGELQRSTKSWYDAEFEQSGGFAEVARQLMLLPTPGGTSAC